MSNVNLEVVIACGGAGTRMSSILGDTPKILAPVGKHSFLDCTLNRWQEYGCTKIHLLLGFGSKEVWAAVMDWKKWNPNSEMKVSATIEPYQLGVIGALRFSESCLSDLFLFTYGDVYPTIPPQLLLDNLDVEDYGCLSVCQKDIAGEPPNILLKNGRINHYSKNNESMTHVDIGMMVLRKKSLKVIEKLDRNLLNEAALLETLAISGKLAGYEHNMPSIHIGDPEAYLNFLQWIEEKNASHKK
ncbi:hypothetical protein VB735_16530 [Halotia wernerae UHCC 0503]|nr:hypothetical protein [Halotia wernerae UHCC 0503]